jgi:hypothetical protein
MWSSDKKVLQLQWEAPAGRQPEHKIVVHVDEMQVSDKGLFGPIENHPSMAHSMPNPIEITGSVIQHAADWSAARVKLKYPQYKMKEAKVQDRLALAIVAKDTCICMTRVPDDVADTSLTDWLQQWACSD